MIAVWDRAPVAGSELLLLLALADAANDDLECWPGIRYLAHKVRVSERHIQRMLGSLEQQGLIQRILHGGRGRYEGWESNRYRLILEMESTDAATMSLGARGGASAVSSSAAVMSSPDALVRSSPDADVTPSPDAQVRASPDADVTPSPDADVTSSLDVQVRTSPDTQVTQNHHRESSGEAEERACARGDARVREMPPAPTHQSRLDSLPNRGGAVGGRDHPHADHSTSCGEVVPRHMKTYGREALLQAYWTGIEGFGSPPRYLLRDATELAEMGATADEVRQMADEKQAGRIDQYELRWLVEDFSRWKGEQRRKAKERAEIEAVKALVEREAAWMREMLGKSA